MSAADLSVGRAGAWSKAVGWVGYAGEWVPIGGGGGGEPPYAVTTVYAATGAGGVLVTVPVDAAPYIDVELVGAGPDASKGARQVVRIPVTPGEGLRVFAPTTSDFRSVVAGIRREGGEWLAIAGNGGGGGGNGTYGGAGGYPNGTAGTGQYGDGGQGGTQTAGGAPGSGSAAGSALTGGTSSGSASSGGAGWFGGGGGNGGLAAGGGGGSSYLATGVRAFVNEAVGTRNGNGKVTVTMYVPVPAGVLAVNGGLIVPASSDAAVDLAAVLGVDLSLVTAARLSDIAAQEAQA